MTFLICLLGTLFRHNNQVLENVFDKEYGKLIDDIFFLLYFLTLFLKLTNLFGYLISFQNSQTVWFSSTTKLKVGFCNTSPVC